MSDQPANIPEPKKTAPKASRTRRSKKAQVDTVPAVKVAVVSTELEKRPFQPRDGRRRLSLQDAEAIAERVANRCTEVEACAMLHINPDHWFEWKCRRKGRGEASFDNMLTRLRGNIVFDAMKGIEEAGFREKNPDWRALDRRLERVIPERFERQAGSVNVKVGLELGLLGAAAGVQPAGSIDVESSTPQPVVHQIEEPRKD